jgi:uncharacterized membrane protein
MTLGVFLLALTAAVCHAGWNFVARKVSGNLVVVWLAILTGCLLLLPVALSILLYYGVTHSVSLPAFGYMMATGVIHAIYFSLLSLAYKKGEITRIYPIARGSGVGGTAICARLFLNEDISFMGSIGIGLIFMGVVAMGGPAFRRGRDFRQIKLALCVGGSIITYSLIDKIGVSKVNPVLYIWAMFFIAAMVLWPLILWRHWGTILKTGKTYMRDILAIGAGSIGTYLMILFAFTLGLVSYVVAIREFAVVIGALLGVVFLKERLTVSKVLAIFTITVGLVCIKAE